MSLTKKSQFDWDGVSIPADSLFANDDKKDEDKPVMPVLVPVQPTPLPVEPGQAPVDMPDVLMPEPEPLPVGDIGAQPMSAEDGAVLLEIGDDEPMMYSFELPFVPGGAYQDEIEDAEIEVEEDEDIEIVNDPWGWQVSSFLDWLCQKMNSVPSHSGRDSVGIERAIAYLEAIDREISKAVRSDINGEIDISEVEKARDELYNGLERLQDRLDRIQSNKHPRKKKKNKKKADENPDMVKEAQKATHVGGIIVTVPLLISSIARTCLNSMVSAGKDIEDVFDKLAEKYELTPREEMEAMQLLADMGYPIRRPRGYHRDEEIDYTSTDNFDWAANYPG